VNEVRRRIAGEAWAFRARVEEEATLRFTRLAEAIAAFDPDSPVPALMRRAAGDEQRHAALCAGLAAFYGRPLESARDAAIAPASFSHRAAVLYEVVAACCITETESVTTLTTLLAGSVDARVRSVLHEIARDEVTHGRMGWAHLAREAAASDVSFLSPSIPAMLAGAAGDRLFAPADPELESADLPRDGVLPHSTKRAIFTGTLEGVVFPGLTKFGIDTGPARAWLAAMRGAGDPGR
jgi:rubrerythrin